MTKYWIILLIALMLILFGIGYFVGGKFDREWITGLLTTEEVKPGKDTVWVQQPAPPPDTVTITKTKIKTIIRDSIVPVYVDRAFTKIIDTTIQEARIRVDWYFPEDSSTIYYQAPPKKVAFIHDTLEITKPSIPIPVQQKYGIKDLLKDVALFLLGAFAGNQL